jgi:type III pantothenate kinase
VSGPYNTLLIDIGNTRIKYVLANANEIAVDIHVCDSPTELTEHIKKAQLIIVSSVGNQAYVQQIQMLCKTLMTSCRVIQTRTENFGIQCAYEHFNTLGTDRWLAILGARTITELPVAVLDLGTANTCDIVVGNQHLGGWIAPGLSIMRESLLNNTQQVFADENNPMELVIGKNTQDCVSLGCLASHLGFITMAEQYLSAKYEDYRVVITGGTQIFAQQYKNNHYIFHSNLVLKGLSRFI